MMPVDDLDKETEAQKDWLDQSHSWWGFLSREILTFVTSAAILPTSDDNPHKNILEERIKETSCQIKSIQCGVYVSLCK